MVMEAGGIFPSEFVEHAFRIPVRNKLVQFSFSGREYLVPIYDTAAKRLLLKCSRQVEKTTTVGNRLIANSILAPYQRALYCTPSEAQSLEFSKARLSAPIEMSPVLKQYMRGKNSQENVLYKRFSNGSDITLRSCHFDASSVRGWSGPHLVIDEIQSINQDIIPVIEMCVSAFEDNDRAYAGTPLSFDNPLETLWSQGSTCNEWVIPCDHCGGGDYRRWNIIDYGNILTQGLSCSHCHKLIDPQHKDAQWASMRSPEWLLNPPESAGIPFEGYRICQPMLPRFAWKSILDMKARYGIAQFHNEVLGLSYDSGEKLITEQSLISCSNPNITEKTIDNFAGRIPLFMGVDWGGGGQGSNSYTAITIGGYDGTPGPTSRFAILSMRRLEGMEAEPANVLPEINRLVAKYKIHLIGTDYGGGHIYNDGLVRTWGAQKILKYQYVNTKLIYFDSVLTRFMCNRTEVMVAGLINAINRLNVFSFPKWETWCDYCSGDFLCLLSERSARAGTYTIIKTPGKTDDIAHATLLCFLASMVQFPRPDILQPDSPKNLSER